MYSKAYQEVTAGRVREDEAISFYGKNKIATPARITTIVPAGASSQPTVKVDYLNDPGVGKQVDQRNPDKTAYIPGKYNV